VARLRRFNPTAVLDEHKCPFLWSHDGNLCTAVGFCTNEQNSNTAAMFAFERNGLLPRGVCSRTSCDGHIYMNHKAYDAFKSNLTREGKRSPGLALLMMETQRTFTVRHAARVSHHSYQHQLSAALFLTREVACSRGTRLTSTAAACMLPPPLPARK
jgi:hypothetical protein